MRDLHNPPPLQPSKPWPREQESVFTIRFNDGREVSYEAGKLIEGQSAYVLTRNGKEIVFIDKETGMIIECEKPIEEKQDSDHFAFPFFLFFLIACGCLTCFCILIYTLANK